MRIPQNELGTRIHVKTRKSRSANDTTREPKQLERITSGTDGRLKTFQIFPNVLIEQSSYSRIRNKVARITILPTKRRSNKHLMHSQTYRTFPEKRQRHSKNGCVVSPNKTHLKFGSSFASSFVRITTVPQLFRDNKQLELLVPSLEVGCAGATSQVTRRIYATSFEPNKRFSVAFARPTTDGPPTHPPTHYYHYYCCCCCTSYFSHQSRMLIQTHRTYNPIPTGTQFITGV